eukprot:CAMPEP_0202697512 /NCGR_PEP_ID=MMETSP1385-20130828/10856_1 /ASSEMBLY_ACC=CAM_ASM_000861 /TAXON_ID=933848 /ORGANISM="Elphidium margaritaceum" /LENGTH=269 /DNA_ID=CAMNT_0049353997 /DNA_START=16 /DNA_END=821 /DNA_ORIENTATION=-
MTDLSNFLILISAIGSTVFTVVPYVANLFFALRIRNIIKQNPTAMSWFQHKSFLFASLVVLTGGCYPALRLISSNMFGWDVFSCGLTRFELKSFTKFKIMGTVVLENLPQLVCQVLYAFVTRDIQQAVVISFIASFLSALSSVISFIIDNESKDTKVVQYYIDVRSTSEDIISDEVQESCTKQSGRRRVLSEQIAAVYQVQAKSIEVGSTMVTSHGSRTHIVHYVAQNDIDALQSHVENNSIDGVTVTAEYLASHSFEANKDEIAAVFR